MTNLLNETLDCLAKHHKTVQDILYIGDQHHYYIPVNEFAPIFNVNYNNSYGSPEVACDLVIVFKDHSWLSRAEYDGKEWWEYHRTPTQINTHKATKVVNPQAWSPTLRECNT